jgi:hypothetical protein
MEGVPVLLDILDIVWDAEYAPFRDRHMRTLNGLIICVPVNEEADFAKMEVDFVDKLLRVKDVDRYDPMVRFSDF